MLRRLFCKHDYRLIEFHCFGYGGNTAGTYRCRKCGKIINK